MDAQFGIIPKIVRLATYQIWILQSSRQLGFLHLIIHVRYVRGQTMVIRCCFAITVMVDTISSTSSRSSLKFPLAIGTVHHALLHHLDSYSDHAMLFPAQVWGGYMRISFQLPLCMHFFLFDQFLSLIGFSLFVQWNLLRIYILMTPYVTTLHVTIVVMPVHGLIHDGQLRACPCALQG